MKIMIWTGVLCSILFLCTFSAVAEERPISVQAAEPNPKTLSGPGAVQVSINISNSSDSSIPVNVTLVDPAGNVCTSFGNQGTSSLSQGQAAAFSGSWSVSEKELEAGKIIYTARYAFQNEDGNPVNGNEPIGISIKKNNDYADLKVERVPPTPMDGAVVQGQTVVLAYRLTNTGTIDITDINITDPSIFDEKVTLPVLKPGEAKELSYSYAVGASAKTSTPTIVYNYKMGNEAKTKKAEGKPFVFNVTVPELLVTLKADTLMVNPGSKVKLTYTITNKGSLRYEQIKINDTLIGDVESGLSLDAGKSYTNSREVTINATGNYQLTVSATSSAGTISVTSETVTIQTIAEGAATVAPGATPMVPAIPIEMEVLIEADRDIIYEEPSEAVFRVIVKNNGTTEVSKVEVYERKKLVKTIPIIPAGEQVEFTKRFTISSGGKFQFVAVANDNLGDAQMAQSEEFQISYKPLPTPTPMPTPTPAPPTAPPVEEEADETIGIGIGIQQTMPPNQGLPDEPVSMGTALLWILAGLLAVVLVAVGVLMLMEKRRSSPQGGFALAGSGNSSSVVIDSIQRTPHRDYARAPKRTSNAKRDNAKKREQPNRQEEATADDGLSQGVERAANRKREEANKAKASREEEKASKVTKRQEPEEDMLDMDDLLEDEDMKIVGDDLSDLEDEEAADYLDTIRKGRRGESKPASAPADAKKKTLSDEEVALLSGSTGQYRLSRNTKAPLPGGNAKAEDPDAFSRKQRASRSKKPDISSFYDDEEIEPAPKNRKRRA